MLRAILLIIALVIIAAIGATSLGLVSFTQTQGAQAPKIDVKVNDVDVGTTTANVQLPSVEMKSRQVEVPAVTVDKGNTQ